MAADSVQQGPRLSCLIFAAVGIFRRWRIHTVGEDNIQRIENEL